MKNITSLDASEEAAAVASKAASIDPLFMYHLVGALSVFDPDFLESCAREYMETYHSEVELRELAKAVEQVKAQRPPSNTLPPLYT